MGRYLLGVAPLMATLSCSGESACDCAKPGVTIAIPPALASQVLSVTVSGRACNGVPLRCTQTDPSGYCLSYDLAPTTYGNCHVDVALQNRTYSSDVTIVQRAGCCSGYYADPLAAGTIEVSNHGLIPGEGS